MSKLVSVTITKTVELPNCSEIWQLSEDQLRKEFTQSWEDWDSVDTQFLICHIEEGEED